MKVAVLLSAGVHPVSGRPMLPGLEAQCVRLALGLGEAVGVHAGPSASPVADALGHGLGRLVHVEIGAADDPVPALVAALSADPPDLILAGRRGQGGDETGLLPYALAAALAMPLAPDAVALFLGAEGDLVVEQALPKGARRRLTVRPPAVVTVHPDAPAARPFAYGAARRGTIERLRSGTTVDRTPAAAFDERPYRRRPKLMRGAPTGGSAAERLAAATGAAGGGAEVMVGPSPEDAAAAVLSYLRRAGVAADPSRGGDVTGSAEGLPD